MVQIKVTFTQIFYKFLLNLRKNKLLLNINWNINMNITTKYIKLLTGSRRKDLRSHTGHW